MFECVNLTHNDDAHNTTSQVSISSVVNQILLPVVCIFGIVGNLLNIVILSWRRKQRSFRTLEYAANLCLIWLAFSDLFFCIFAFMTTFLPANNIYDNQGFWLFFGKYSHAIINVFIMESTMLTVAMSLERYLAICFPLRQDIYLTTSRIKFIIFFTVLFSIAINIPILWRVDAFVICASEQYDPSTALNNISFVSDYPNPVNSFQGPSMDQLFSSLNVTKLPINVPKNNDALVAISNNLPNITIVANISSVPSSTINQIPSYSSTTSSQPFSPMPTHVFSDFSSVKADSIKTANKVLYTTSSVFLGGNHTYESIYRFIWASFGNFIPLGLLFFFNVCLCQKIYRSYKLRTQLGRQNMAKSSSHILTITLVAIVALFFIFVAPSEVTLIISDMTISADSPTFKNIESVINLMQSVNFSVNFILYCTISPHFRRTLKQMIMCSYCRTRDSAKRFTLKFQSSRKM